MNGKKWTTVRFALVAQLSCLGISRSALATTISLSSTC